MSYSLISWIPIVITLIVVFAAMVGFFDAVRRSDEAFAAVGRGPKIAWLIGLLLSAIVVFFGGMMSFFGIIATIATVVYHVDQKPKLIEVQRPRW